MNPDDILSLFGITPPADATAVRRFARPYLGPSRSVGPATYGGYPLPRGHAEELNPQRPLEHMADEASWWVPGVSEMRAGAEGGHLAGSGHPLAGLALATIAAIPGLGKYAKGAAKEMIAKEGAAATKYLSTGEIFRNATHAENYAEIAKRGLPLEKHLIHDGFMTDADRFVNRREGNAIAASAGQHREPYMKNQYEMTSEDMRPKPDSVVSKGVPAVAKLLESLQHPEGARLPRVMAVDKEKGAAMARAYAKLPKNDPAAKAAYDALNAEVEQQFKAMHDAGYTAEFVDHDPYKNSAEMIADVRDNKRLKVFKTPAGGEFHPYMTPEQNDKFRAVHDWLAHAGEGHQFGPTGEENAYRVHASTLSPEARRALATETRGQNSWVNFGPNAHLPAKERPFAEQKAALWPDELQGDYDVMPEDVKHAITISMEPSSPIAEPRPMPTPWDKQLADSVGAKVAKKIYR